ncbi:MAG: 3-isopropylmalate dehydratase [Methanoculleus sp.]|uniref:LeuD/DmdB family oxidoreductase small subunit n=1 Tax=unclassified Methanoculleus TaxID=2619537 RepID=UPI0025F265C7|nr:MULTISPECIES: 3-isopropylmalate dehydratase [unclassified Methanoculleus]MCK9318110.1 3-isopropylmalate dehydratase [Methanoculleus sp.]MDD2253340.1 3-isopropylmalate dehydratase [Methanoculleus sp.]MDD3216107.1 3-isopropylmalate dehydratase [Methanoculleus sp.]MDD4314048.1 3-isopropylmalate dehydratase [Methanoculleus sp.]MDD4471575.1 3-isopropylmalate dehydratase [Methanoculleus sp.]
MQGVGPAVCLGNDIDTDVIIAGRYLRTKDRSVWAKHVFEDLDPSLAGRIRGAIIVAGRNMGCGSSREQAVVALREAGVIGVVAPSFARIFFRNAVNVGLPVIEAEVACIDGARVVFDLDSGWVEVDGERHPARPLSEKMVAILRAGGLVPYWRSSR